MRGWAATTVNFYTCSHLLAWQESHSRPTRRSIGFAISVQLLAPPTGKSIGKSERQRRPDNLLIRAMLITQKLSLSLSILSRCSPTYGPHNSELRYSRRDNKKGVQTKTSPILPTPLTQKKKITPNGALLPRDSKVTKNADVKRQNKKTTTYC